MKTEVRTIYKCDHCNKLYQRKHFCEMHERACKKQPNYMRPCHNCDWLSKERQLILTGYHDSNGNEIERVVEVLYCNKKDIFIYPPSVGFKGNAFDIGDKLNVEMPIKCDKQETKYNIL